MRDSYDDRSPAVTGMAAPWAKRLGGLAVCFVGVHDWSDWKVEDPDRPWKQVRTCARCSKTKSNAAPAPIKAENLPFF